MADFKKANRLNKFKTGIFATLMEKRQELLDSGRQVYDLWVGTPDFAPPKHVIDAMEEAVKDPNNYKYALADHDDLAEALIKYYKERYKADISKDEFTSVRGTQEGMGHLGLATCNPGDYVLLPDPGYPIYEAASMLAEADIYHYNMLKDNNFLPNFKEIPEEILKKTKYLVLSYPSNPTGAAAPKEIFIEAIEYAKKYDFFIINDMAYSDIIFDGKEGFSFLSLPGAKEVGVEFFSLSKSFNLTGLRISFLIGNKSIVDSLKLLRSQYDFGTSLIAQKAAIAALEGPKDYIKEQCKAYQDRRDALCDGLRRAGWDIENSDGTMFVWLPVPKGYNSQSFMEALIDKCGVVATPGDAFGKNGEGYIRIALVYPAEILAQIADIIGKNIDFK